MGPILGSAFWDPEMAPVFGSLFAIFCACFGKNCRSDISQWAPSISHKRPCLAAYQSSIPSRPLTLRKQKVRVLSGNARKAPKQVPCSGPKKHTAKRPSTQSTPTPKHPWGHTMRRGLYWKRFDLSPVTHRSGCLCGRYKSDTRNWDWDCHGSGDAKRELGPLKNHDDSTEGRFTENRKS